MISFRPWSTAASIGVRPSTLRGFQVGAAATASRAAGRSPRLMASNRAALGDRSGWVGRDRLRRAAVLQAGQGRWRRRDRGAGSARDTAGRCCHGRTAPRPRGIGRAIQASRASGGRRVKARMPPAYPGCRRAASYRQPSPRKVKLATRLVRRPKVMAQDPRHHQRRRVDRPAEAAIAAVPERVAGIDRPGLVLVLQEAVAADLIGRGRHAERLDQLGLGLADQRLQPDLQRRLGRAAGQQQRQDETSRRRISGPPAARPARRAPSTSGSASQGGSSGMAAMPVTVWSPLRRSPIQPPGPGHRAPGATRRSSGSTGSAAGAQPARRAAGRGQDRRQPGRVGAEVGDLQRVGGGGGGEGAAAAVRDLPDAGLVGRQLRRGAAAGAGLQRVPAGAAVGGGDGDLGRRRRPRRCGAATCSRPASIRAVRSSSSSSGSRISQCAARRSSSACGPPPSWPRDHSQIWSDSSSATRPSPTRSSTSSGAPPAPFHHRGAAALVGAACCGTSGPSWPRLRRPGWRRSGPRSPDGGRRAR